MAINRNFEVSLHGGGHLPPTSLGPVFSNYKNYKLQSAKSALALIVHLHASSIHPSAHNTTFPHKDPTKTAQNRRQSPSEMPKFDTSTVTSTHRYIHIKQSEATGKTELGWCCCSACPLLLLLRLHGLPHDILQGRS